MTSPWIGPYPTILEPPSSNKKDLNATRSQKHNEPRSVGQRLLLALLLASHPIHHQNQAPPTRGGGQSTAGLAQRFRRAFFEQLENGIDWRRQFSFDRCPVKMTVTYGVDKCPKKFDEYRCTLSDKYRVLAKEQLREDDTLREQALESMRGWIAKHPYIRRCRTDSLFLLRFLRQRKFSIPLACEMLERYLAMRQTFAHWFQNLDPFETNMKEISSNQVFQALGFDDKGRINILIKSRNFNVERFNLVHLIRYLHMYMEIMSCDERIQVAGIVLVVDCFQTTMMHFTLFNLSDMKNMMPYINHLLPVRCKEIHVIRLPKMSVTLVDILFTFVSPKLKHRFFVSTKQVTGHASSEGDCCQNCMNVGFCTTDN